MQIVSHESFLLLLKLGQSDLALSNRQDYLDANKPVNAAYQTLIREFAQTLTDDPSTIDADLNAMYDFERRLAQVIVTIVDSFLEENLLVSLERGGSTWTTK